ncbi:SDR family oxidoreductase [Paenibacillus sp. PR3]|uniref:SDR family oxidoreductase n=1 Tax=Paenibacillus terricola TaxID=2763503 RepID=A0ABR8N2P7_9BACL|nr:SDR family NAD(P)-dependent oxidoreductase [Paenibacillus terricola]MBD3922445.1 SDR family oxidoreductase [Paenibacillus terricola]
MSNNQVKTAVITGAAGGIGRELARRLAERKLNLVLVDLKEEAVKAVAEELGLDNTNSLTIAADVSKEEDVRNYVKKAVEKFGTIDYFANNAGIEGPSGLIEEQSVEALDLVYNVNVRGVFLGLKYVIPVMKEQKSGAILNTSSLAGLIGGPGVSPYIMSKHAVIGLTRVAANEVAAQGIRVNAVLPGTINTGMMRRIESNFGDADQYKTMNEAATPMGRYGEPQEVAAVMNFLLSDEASFVTASLYTVDGGMVGQ